MARSNWIAALAMLALAVGVTLLVQREGDAPEGLVIDRDPAASPAQVGELTEVVQGVAGSAAHEVAARSTRARAREQIASSPGPEPAVLSVRVVGPEGITRFARLTLTDPNGVRRSAACDLEGIGRLEELEAGVAWRVRVYDEEFQRSFDFEDQRFAPGEQREFVFRLGKGCSLRGQLRDERGVPVVEHEVQLSRRFINDSGTLGKDMSGVASRMAVLTDSQGVFEFEYVGFGSWWIWPSGNEVEGESFALPGRASTFREITLEEPRKILLPLAQAFDLREGHLPPTIALTLVAGVPISGSVLNADGQPTLSATVVARSKGEPPWERTILTEERGEFEFKGLPPGEFELVAIRNTGESTLRISETRQGEEGEPFMTYSTVYSEKRDAFAGERGVVLRFLTNEDEATPWDGEE